MDCHGIGFKGKFPLNLPVLRRCLFECKLRGNVFWVAAVVERYYPEIIDSLGVDNVIQGQSGAFNYRTLSHRIRISFRPGVYVGFFQRSNGSCGEDKVLPYLSSGL